MQDKTAMMQAVSFSVVLAAVACLAFAQLGGPNPFPTDGEGPGLTLPIQDPAHTWPVLEMAASAGLPDHAFAASDNPVTARLIPVARMQDDVDGFVELKRPFGVDTFQIGSGTYAIVAAHTDNGVQIVDITDPANPVATAYVRDSDTRKLEGARNIDIFAINDRTYAIIASIGSNGVQVIDVTDPHNPIAAGYIEDATRQASGPTAQELGSPLDVATFRTGEGTYAVVTASTDNAIQIIDITDPFNLAPAGHLVDDDSLELELPFGVDTFEIGVDTYAIVVGHHDDGIQIINVTDPYNPTAAGHVRDSDTLELHVATDVAIFEDDGNTYAFVAGYEDHGIQIINVTDPFNPAPAGRITHADEGLGQNIVARVDTFEAGGSAYAVVTAYYVSGIHLIDLADPFNPTHMASTMPSEFSGGFGVDVFEVGGSAYAIAVGVTSNDAHIVQISMTVDRPPGVVPNPQPSTSIPVGSTYEDAGATCTDETDGDLTDQILAVSSVNATVPGDYTVVYSCTDSAGNTATAIRTVAVVDDTALTVAPAGAPRITLAGTTPIKVSVGATYEDAGATCTDEADGDLTGDLRMASDVNVYTHGNYTVTYSCADSVGNTATAARTVAVVDDTAPQITLAGPDTVMIRVGSDYDDTGATCRDGVEGDLTGDMTVTDSINASVPGEYAVTYSCADSVGNTATAARTVTVTDAITIITDGVAGFNELDGAYSVATFKDGDGTYAIVTAFYDDGIQIINVTDPARPAAMASISDDASLNLDGSRGIATFKDGDGTYAIVTAFYDDGIQIINVTDPARPAAMASISDDASLNLDGSRGIATFKDGDGTYAIVAASDDDGIQIINVTDPANPVPNGQISDYGKLELDGAYSVATFKDGDGTYAIVAASDDDGIQIINVTDPANPTAEGYFSDKHRRVLGGAYDVATFKDGDGTYAIVTASDDDGMQIVNITNPSRITAEGRMKFGSVSSLAGPSGVTTFKDGDRTYAIVAQFMHGSVRIIDITNPSKPATNEIIRDDLIRELDGALDVATFQTGGNTYAIVTAHADDGAQIIPVVEAVPVGPATIEPDQTVQELEPVITTDSRSPTNAQNVMFTVDFGKAVDPVTFDSSDISVSSGDASEPSTTDNQIFTFTVGSPDDGILTASIPASTVLYADDNANPASGVASVEIDTVSPKVTSIERIDPSGQITGYDALTFGVAFNEPVTGVDAGDFAISLEAIGYHGQFTHARTMPMPIPDAGEAIADIITVADLGRIASVSVDVDITHSYIGDLVVDLVAPDGTTMNLHNRTGTHGDNIDRTYTPDFDGTVAAGDWVLRVSDNSMFDTGTLNEWTLTIVSSDVAEAVTGLNGTGAQYQVTVSAALNGTYNLDIVPNNGITDIAGNLLNGTIPTGEDQSYIVNTSFILNATSNNPPLADAGPDQTIHEGQTVTLNGTAVDVEGDPLTYSWRHDSASLAIGFANDILPSTTFTAPWVDSNSTVTFTLTADDGNATASDSMNVNIIDTSHPSRGPSDIGRISLANTISGTVQVSWETPEETPISYRISWAKVGEPYPTWTDSTGNAFPTVPSQTITGLAEGVQYRMKVRAVYDGNSGDWSGEAITTVTRTASTPATVPGAPTSLGVLPNGSGTLAVSWQAPNTDGGSTITGYTVQWKAASGSWTVPADVTEAATTGTAHTIAGLTDGTPYAVRVLATNGIGNGEPTSEETATPQAPALGPRDIGVITLNGTTPGTIQVSWEEPGKEPANYRVMWAKVGEAYLTWTDSTGNAFPTVPSQAITGLEEGAQYKVKVRAVYDGTAGDWSAEVTVTVARTTTNTHATGSPAITGTTRVGQTLTADASGITDADGMTNSTLRYQWISNDGTADTDIAGATASSHVLAAGDEGRTIKVRVAFTDDAGHAESLTSAATQAVAPAFTVPGAPTSLSVLPNGSDTLAVSWQAPASNGGQNITGYTVQWKESTGSWDTPSDVTEAASTGTSHTITGLTDGTPYAVRVLATNGIGNGEPTPAETATPQAPAPPLGPRDVGTVTLSSTTPGTVQASWDEPDEKPANYRISWTKVGEPYLTWTNSTGNAFPTAPSHTITGLAEGVEYKLKVRASYDGTAGDWSAEVTVAISPTNTATIPGSPQNLAVSTNGSGTLAVSWQAPASNGGSNITGYAVQWKESTGSWDSSSDVTETATTGTAHAITGLTDGTPYAVRVLATNGIGDGEPTPEETATPQAPAPPLGPRDIGVITLSSTTPGTIQVSWEEPDEEPANYRVMWARAGEPYLTWTDSAGNAFPTAPSHTITGLAEGVEYKLKVRASYDGTAGDWSGEVTVTVARTG